MVPLAPLLQACLSLLILLLLVCCLLPPGAQGQVSPLRVEPQNPVVPTGGSLLVNCSADCPDPENIILETALSKQPVGSGLSWSAFQLSNVTGDSDIICAGFCNGSQISGSTSITVYRLPERMELAPLPPWQPVGENFTLHCQVWGGAPRANLSMVLFRGQEELGRQPAVGEPAEVTATMPARREDYGANFSCSTQLDLRPQGLGLLENSSTSRQLRTFALPMTRPFLTAPRILEVGKETAVNCSLDGVFPVWEAQVHMTLGDQMLNSTVVSHGDALRATAMATAREEQKGAPIVCKVTQVLQCQARGNPDPMLQCLQEGSRIKVPVGIPFFVRLYHNGTYHCQAISPRGITTVEVVMEVQDRNARSVTIAMVVLLVLSLVIVTAALLYVFGVQRRRGSYCVKHESTSLPLTSTQPDGLPGEEPS